MSRVRLPTLVKEVAMVASSVVVFGWVELVVQGLCQPLLLLFLDVACDSLLCTAQQCPVLGEFPWQVDRMRSVEDAWGRGEGGH